MARQQIVDKDMVKGVFQTETKITGENNYRPVFST